MWYFKCITFLYLCCGSCHVGLYWQPWRVSDPWTFPLATYHYRSGLERNFAPWLLSQAVYSTSLSVEPDNDGEREKLCPIWPELGHSVIRGHDFCTFDHDILTCWACVEWEERLFHSTVTSFLHILLWNIPTDWLVWFITSFNGQS